MYLSHFRMVQSDRRKNRSENALIGAVWVCFQSKEAHLKSPNPNWHQLKKKGLQKRIFYVIVNILVRVRCTTIKRGQKMFVIKLPSIFLHCNFLFKPIQTKSYSIEMKRCNFWIVLSRITLYQCTFEVSSLSNIF